MHRPNSIALLLLISCALPDISAANRDRCLAGNFYIDDPGCSNSNNFPAAPSIVVETCRRGLARLSVDKPFIQCCPEQCSIVVIRTTPTYYRISAPQGSSCSLLVAAGARCTAVVCFPKEYYGNVSGCFASTYVADCDEFPKPPPPSARPQPISPPPPPLPPYAGTCSEKTNRMAGSECDDDYYLPEAPEYIVFACKAASVDPGYVYNLHCCPDGCSATLNRAPPSFYPISAPQCCSCALKIDKEIGSCNVLQCSSRSSDADVGCQASAWTRQC
jgi:hypothetical protein